MTEWPTREGADGVLVLSPEGRLNMNAAPDLRDQLHALVRAGNTRVVVDLAAVETIDSSGLGALIAGLKAARQAGGDLRIVSPSEQATAVLELTNLNRVFRVAESADSAFSDQAPQTDAGV